MQQLRNGGCLMSRSGFARQMAVHRSTVTRWAQLGMPCDPDGRVRVAEARRWVAANVIGASSGGFSRPAPTEIVPMRSAEPLRRTGFLLAATEALLEVPILTTIAVAEAGGTKGQAIRTAETLTLMMWERLDELAARHSITSSDEAAITLPARRLLTWKASVAWANLFDAAGKAKPLSRESC